MAAWRRTIATAAGRATNSVTAARASAAARGTVPTIVERTAPKRMNANNMIISEVASPYSRKQSQSSMSRAAIAAPAANAARKPSPPTSTAPVYEAKTRPMP